jgi:hypothetical protein
MRTELRYAAQIGLAIPVKKSTIPQSTVGYLFGQQIRRGTERRLCLWQHKIGEKSTLWGWVRHGPLASGRPISMGSPALHLKHTTINLGSAGWGRNKPGDGEVAAFCGVHFFGVLAGGFFLMASLNCNRAGKFDRSTRSLASTF